MAQITLMDVPSLYRSLLQQYCDGRRTEYERFYPLTRKLLWHPKRTIRENRKSIYPEGTRLKGAGDYFGSGVVHLGGLPVLGRLQTLTEGVLSALAEYNSCNEEQMASLFMIRRILAGTVATITALGAFTKLFGVSLPAKQLFSWAHGGEGHFFLLLLWLLFFQLLVLSVLELRFLRERRNRVIELGQLIKVALAYRSKEKLLDDQVSDVEKV